MNWHIYIWFADVTYVLHTASPYVLVNIKNGEEELLKPAIHGTMNVLKAAKAAGVEKVVITSSFAAISNLKTTGPWGDVEYTEKGALISRPAAIASI